MMPTSRPPPAAVGNEEATAYLNLGPEFTGVPTLSNSEARILITAITDQQRKVNPNFKESETLSKTQDYLQLFARFKHQSTITQCESILRGVESLQPFERSQLGTLLPQDAEEAKTLIPSLANKIGDEQLQQLCEEMEELRHAADED